MIKWHRIIIDDQKECTLLYNATCIVSTYQWCINTSFIAFCRRWALFEVQGQISYQNVCAKHNDNVEDGKDNPESIH